MFEARSLWSAAACQRYAAFDYDWAFECRANGDVAGFIRHMRAAAEYAHMARYLMGVDE